MIPGIMQLPPSSRHCHSFISRSSSWSASLSMRGKCLSEKFMSKSQVLRRTRRENSYHEIRFSANFSVSLMIFHRATFHCLVFFERNMLQKTQFSALQMTENFLPKLAEVAKVTISLFRALNTNVGSGEVTTLKNQETDDEFCLHQDRFKSQV